MCGCVRVSACVRARRGSTRIFPGPSRPARAACARARVPPLGLGMAWHGIWLCPRHAVCARCPPSRSRTLHACSGSGFFGLRARRRPARLPASHARTVASGDWRLAVYGTLGYGGERPAAQAVDPRPPSQSPPLPTRHAAGERGEPALKLPRPRASRREAVIDVHTLQIRTGPRTSQSFAGALPHSKNG